MIICLSLVVTSLVVPVPIFFNDLSSSSISLSSLPVNNLYVILDLDTGSSNSNVFELISLGISLVYGFFIRNLVFQRITVLSLHARFSAIFRFVVLSLFS